MSIKNLLLKNFYETRELLLQNPTAFVTTICGNFYLILIYYETRQSLLQSWASQGKSGQLYCTMHKLHIYFMLPSINFEFR